jgi:hypothetical protein
LGIATSVAPGYVLDVSGASILRGITTLTKNAYIQGNLGIGKTSANVALDVSGTVAISSNITVTGTTFTNRLGVGKLTDWITPYVMDISGNTRMTGSLAVSNNLDVSGNTRIIGSTTITGQGVGTNAPTLNVIGNINYTPVPGQNATLTGQNATLTGIFKARSVGINIGTSSPQQALDIVGDGALTGTLSVGSVSSTTIFTNALTVQGNFPFVNIRGANATLSTPYIYIGKNATLIPSLTYYLELEGAARIGNASSPGQIILNKNSGTYEFDMSGTFNTTTTISSNLYVQNIYGTGTTPDPNTVNVYGIIRNNTEINTPKMSINTAFPINPLSVTGTSDFIGNTNTTGTVTVTGDIIQTRGSGYLSAPTNITVIQYGGTGGTNWSIIGTNVTLYLDTWPMFYVIDGAGTNTDLSVTIQSDGVLRTGLTFNFISRRTTVGHTILYPYASGSTYTKTLTTPLSFPLLCIGTNDYSST